MLVVPWFALAVAARLDPKRPLREMEKKIERGEKVVLIGDKGGPAWSQWRTGEESGKRFVSAEETFTVSCDGFGMLELLHDLRWDAYRFRARVRHERTDNLQAYVGVYCLCRESAGKDAPVHFFTQYVYDDKKSAREQWEHDHQHPPAEVLRPRFPMKTIGIYPRIFAETDQQMVSDFQFAGSTTELIMPGFVSQPAPWRTLDIVVTRDSIRCWWGEGGEKQQVGQLTAHQLQALLWDARSQWPNDHSLERIDMSFAPRGSLGLVINRGAASFAEVEIQPLKPAE